MAKKLGITYELVGSDQLDKSLAQLPRAVRKQVVLSTLRKGAKNPAKMASALAPEDSGDLADDIQVRDLKVNGRRVAAVTIGPTKKSFWGLFSEFGTEARTVKSTGRGAGRVSPRPYMRPAWDAWKAKLQEMYPLELWRKLRLKAKQLARKAKAGRLAKRLRGRL